MTTCTNCGEQIPENEGLVENTREGTMCLGCAGVCFYVEEIEDLDFDEEEVALWETTLMDGLEDEEEWKDD